jgi:hypothetical protein
MQKRGIYFHPGQFERWFISTEHTEKEIDITIAAAEESIKAVARIMPPGKSAADQVDLAIYGGTPS